MRSRYQTFDLPAWVVAGMLARVVSHPIDTVKARIQVHTDTAATEYRNVFRGVRATFAAGGMRALYQGFPITFVGSAPGTMLYFSSYEASVAKLSSSSAFLKDHQSLTHFASGTRDFIFCLVLSSHFTVIHLSDWCTGIIAEAVSCVVWVPIDVIKERLQVQGLGHTFFYRNTTDAIRQILITERLPGLYRGYGATVGSFGPFSAFYFMFYEQVSVLTRIYTTLCGALWRRNTGT
jgi:hypothetical protein